MQIDKQNITDLIEQLNDQNIEIGKANTELLGLSYILMTISEAIESYSPQTNEAATALRSVSIMASRATERILALEFEIDRNICVLREVLRG